MTPVVAAPVDVAQWWKVQKLPTGEVQLTVFPGASPVPRKVATRVAQAALVVCGVWALVTLSLFMPLFVAAFLGIWALVIRGLFPAEEVWLLRPKHAACRVAGEEGESTFEVASVALERVADAEDHGWWLQASLVGSRRKVKIGKRCAGSRSTSECEALARTMSEALAVPLVRADD
jgi:hypothetical protein